MTDPPRRLSSSLTFVSKYVFPILWIGGFGFATADLFSSQPRINWEGGPPAPWQKWLFGGMLIAGTYMIARIAIPLKRVILAEGCLRISNFLREVQVPLEDVVQVGLVTSWRMNRTPIGLIELARDWGFGTEIQFYPRSEESYEGFAQLVDATQRRLLRNGRVTEAS